MRLLADDSYFETIKVSKVALLKVVLILFSCAISVVHIESFYYQYNYPKWVVFDLFCIFLISLSVYFSPRISVNIVSLLVGLLSLYMLFSLMWVPNRFEGIQFIIRFLAAVISIFTLASLIKKERLIDILTESVFYSSVVFCVVLAYERYWLGIPYGNTNFSPIGFVNYLGQVLNIWIPILVLSIYIKRKSIAHLVLGLASLMLLMNLLVESNTRGTILGLLSAEILVLLLVLIKTKKFAFKYLSISFVFVLAVGTFSYWKNSGTGKLEEQVQSIQNMDTGRDNIFLNTLDMVKDNPFGVGVNNFEFVHQKYAKAGTSESSPYVSRYQVLLSPYNIILKFYSELGLVGGSLFALLYGWVLFRALRNLLNGNFIDAWIFMAVFSLSFHAMFSSVYLTPVSLFFSVILFSVVFSKEKSNTQFTSIGKRRSILILLPVALSLTYLSVVKTASGYLTAKGARLGETRLVEKALKINPQDYFAAVRLSDLYLYKERNKDAALKSLEHAINLYPYHVYLLIRAAELSLQLGLTEKAKKYKQRALDIYPSNYRASVIDTEGK